MRETARIRLLPEHLVREIAAGEVIESPSDVLKELLDNALDAGATRLEVGLVEGGSEHLVVSDNGCGIARDDLPLAVEPHATSKLESLERIETLGFRGEGLYAIRQAATLTMTSRPASQLGGARLKTGGDFLEVTEVAASPGTRTEVSDLFELLPARKRALSDAALETKKAVGLLSRYLLHHARVQVKLMSDGKEYWAYGGGSTLDAVRFFWGAVSANRMLEFDTSGAALRAEGALSRPELSRPRRDRLLLAVNGRPVEWPERLVGSLQTVYGDMLPNGHYPVGVVNLTVPPQTVLVNTAPDKRRVRFLQEDEVCAFLGEAVGGLLAGHPLAPALPELRTVDGVASAPRHAFPELRYLGRYRDLYLLAEAEAQLWVVDQHAAHERIIFEELERRYRAEPPLELASAELLTLTPEQAADYQARREKLARLGVVLEPFGGGRWRIRSVPAFLAAHPDLLAEVVQGALGKEDVEQAWRSVLGRLACLPAVKAGSPLSGLEAQALLNQLRACLTPWACPHGRPTALVLSELELARRFGRRGVRASEALKTA